MDSLPRCDFFHSHESAGTGATLSGTITDAQGGAIPNANISAKNVATGISTETTTNATGAYSIPNLNPSDHEVISWEVS